MIQTTGRTAMQPIFLLIIRKQQRNLKVRKLTIQSPALK